VVITANSLDAHAGPAAGSSMEFTLGAGNMVDATARAGDWMQIRGDQGRVGWIDAEHT